VRARAREGRGGHTSRPSAPLSPCACARPTDGRMRAGAAATSPPPSRMQSDIDIVGAPALLHLHLNLVSHLHIPVDHLRAPLRLHFPLHPQLQLFRDARKMDNCALASASQIYSAECTPCLWSRSARRRRWARQLSASGAGPDAEGRSGAREQAAV
jgi:hypothetical protein